MPKKRSNGEGALRKRQNGLWECMIMTGFQPNGKRKYKSFYARTQREVLQKVKDYQTAIDSGLDVTKREPTFAEWAQKWYDSYREQVSPTTYEGYGYTLKTLNKTFGAMPLRSIKAADVEAFLRELTADGKHQSQASKCRGMMFQIMRKAQANDLILKNPVELADKTRQKPQKKQKGLLHSGRSPKAVQIPAARQNRRQHTVAAAHGYALAGAAGARSRAHRAGRLVRPHQAGGEAGKGHGIRRNDEERN